MDGTAEYLKLMGFEAGVVFRLRTNADAWEILQNIGTGNKVIFTPSPAELNPTTLGMKIGTVAVTKVSGDGSYTQSEPHHAAPVGLVPRDLQALWVHGLLTDIVVPEKNIEVPEVLICGLIRFFPEENGKITAEDLHWQFLEPVLASPNALCAMFEQ